MAGAQSLLLIVASTLAAGVVGQQQNATAGASNSTAGGAQNSTAGGAHTNSTGAAGKPAGAAAGGHYTKPPPTKADFLNIDVRNWILYTWAAILAVLITYRAVIFLNRHIRHIACLNNDTQQYFAKANRTHGQLKRYIFDAPLFRLRHNREFRLSSAINMGTLPSRFQTLFLIGFFAMNITFCVFSIQWSNKSQAAVLAQLRNRTGVLATINMIPLVLMAGRNNPLIKWTGITFDTYNLLHRWIGRIIVLEAIAHTAAYLTSKVHTAGWAGVQKSMHSEFIYSGTIGTIGFVVLLFQSPSVIRHAFYEAFLHTHIIAAAVAIAGVYVHVKELPQLKLLQAVVALWVVERLVRLITIVYRNIGNGGTKAEIEVLPGDAVRITMKAARAWHFRPGQHAYIYLPAVGWWTSHPFSAAWSEMEEDLVDEKGLPVSVKDVDVMRRKRETVSFVVRRRTGFTEKLYKKADLSPEGRFVTTCIVEGPYGKQSHSSYGTVLLFAAGVGITHQVPHIRDLVTGFSTGTVATRKVILVWIIQSPEHLEWIRPWMTTILGLPRRREVLKILLFVTRPRSTKEIHSPSSSVQMFPGKPNVQALVDAEVESATGAMCVSVCGTGGLADDVRRATRRWMDTRNVEFLEESFSW